MALLERNLNLSQRVVNELGQSIVSSQENDCNIPPEAVLCEQFGVSRSAVREAVKMLTSKGLIYSRPRHGIMVSPRQEWNIFDTDVLRWMFNATRSLDVLKQFLQFRLDIEPGAAALAAKNATQEQLDVISQALNDMDVAQTDEEKHLEADINFHINILVATNNPFYIGLKNFIRTALRSSISYTSYNAEDVVDFESVVKEHKTVLTAIEQRDETAARQAMHGLVAEALHKVETNFDK